MKWFKIDSTKIIAGNYQNFTPHYLQNYLPEFIIQDYFEILKYYIQFKGDFMKELNYEIVIS